MAKCPVCKREEPCTCKPCGECGSLIEGGDLFRKDNRMVCCGCKYRGGAIGEIHAPPFSSVTELLDLDAYDSEGPTVADYYLPPEREIAVRIGGRIKPQ